jgi:hypothetical protein
MCSGALPVELTNSAAVIADRAAATIALADRELKPDVAAEAEAVNRKSGGRKHNSPRLSLTQIRTEC